MLPELVVFLDECMPRQLVDILSAVLCGRPERPGFVHLLKELNSGAGDIDWAKHCKERGYLPLTKDCSRSNNGPKLARVAASINLFYVVLTPKVAQQDYHEVARAIVCVWPEIVDAYRTGRSNAKIKKRGDGRSGYWLDVR